MYPKRDVLTETLNIENSYLTILRHNFHHSQGILLQSYKVSKYLYIAFPGTTMWSAEGASVLTNYLLFLFQIVYMSVGLYRFISSNRALH